MWNPMNTRKRSFLHGFVAEIPLNPSHHCLSPTLNHKMLGIGPPTRGQIGPKTAQKPSDDEITRCWGSAGAFKLVGR